MKYPLLLLFLASVPAFLAAAPVNDAFADAIAMTTDGVSGSNVGATREAGEPDHAQIPGGKSVWWSWTPTVQSTVTIDTSGSSFDTVLAVYTGETPATLTAVAYSDDIDQDTLASKVSFTARAHRTYRIAVDGYNGAAGVIKLRASTGPDTSKSENDDYADRAVLAGDFTVAHGSSLYATTEANENYYYLTTDDFYYYNYSGTNSVWWTWTAPRSGQVTITNDMLINGAFFGDYLYAVVEVFAEDAETISDFSDYPWGARGASFSTASSASITLNVTAGEVLQIKASSWDAYYGGQITLTVEMDTEAIVNDKFAKRAFIDSTNVDLLSATNNGATADTDEPAHAGVAAAQSLWWTWVAPSNGYLTIKTSGSELSDTVVLDTTLGVYTGSELAGLVSVDANDDVSESDITSSVHFAVSKGVRYQIAVDSKNGTGTVKLDLDFISATPVITVQPENVIAYLDDPSATLTVKTTGAAAVYDWQYKAAGSKQWVHYSDGTTILPVLLGDEAQSSLTIAGPLTADMNGDQFRCVITNAAAQIISRIVTLKVVSLTTYAGSSPVVDLSGVFLPLPPATTITYYAAGLPSGLVLNKTTGVITGRVNKAGTYRITYWAVTVTGGVKTKTAVHDYILTAQSYPTLISGAFEGLLVNGSGVPVGKVALLARNTTGAFSGKLTYLNKAYSLRGLLVLDSVSAPTSGGASLSLAGSLTLNITVNADATMTATLTGTDGLIGDVGTDGTQMKTYTVIAPAPWAGTYTMAFTNPTSGPEGSGYGFVKIDGKGMLRLRGKLADGTAITAAVASDVSANGTYRPYVQLYSNRLGFLAGWLPLSPQNFGTGLYHIETGAGLDFYWSKPALPKDKAYPAGFGPVGVEVVMEPWIAASQSYLLGPLGLVTAADSQGIGNFSVIFDQAGGVSNTGSNTDMLPVSLGMDARSRVSVTPNDPNPSNPSKWTVKVNPTTGQFLGGFVLQDKRKVSYEGVLLQLPSGTSPNAFGRGFFRVLTGGTMLSGDVIFTGPDIP